MIAAVNGTVQMTSSSSEVQNAQRRIGARDEREHAGWWLSHFIPTMMKLTTKIK